jgi:hypothetical protein
MPDLVAASEHLHYEMMMLIGTARGLASGVAGESVLNNALLESFTLHARALLAFLYADKPRPDDVVAEDFVSDWVSKRPPETAPLARVHFRVGKEIAHLTYERLSVTEEARQWRFVEVAEEMQRVLNVFVQLTPDDSFGPSMTQYKASMGNPDETP